MSCDDVMKAAGTACLTPPGDDPAADRAGRPRGPRPCVQRAFEERARCAPGAIAVEFEGRALTYGELDGRADDLAGRLGRLGVGPDVPVAPCLGRSLRVLVAVLAVLKAGGAYVPLDPAYPAGRLAFMLEDAAAPLLVTEPDLAGLLRRAGAGRLLLDDDGRASRSARRRWARAGRRAGGRRTWPTSSTPPARPAGPRACRSRTRRWSTSSTRCADRPGLGAERRRAAGRHHPLVRHRGARALPAADSRRRGRAASSRDVAGDGPRLLAALDAAGRDASMQATPATWRLLLEAGWRGRPRR